MSSWWIVNWSVIVVELRDDDEPAGVVRLNDVSLVDQPEIDAAGDRRTIRQYVSCCSGCSRARLATLTAASACFTAASCWS